MLSFFVKFMTASYPKGVCINGSLQKHRDGAAIERLYRNSQLDWQGLAVPQPPSRACLGLRPLLHHARYLSLAPMPRRRRTQLLQPLSAAVPALLPAILPNTEPDTRPVPPG